MLDTENDLDAEHSQFGSMLISGGRLYPCGQRYHFAGRAVWSHERQRQQHDGEPAADLGGRKMTIVTNAGLTLDGGVNLNGNQLTFDGTGTTTVNGTVTGAGGIVKQGSGTTVLATANSYTGTTTVSGGKLGIRNTGALGAADGTPANGTFLSGGTLRLDSRLTMAREYLTVDNSGVMEARADAEWQEDAVINGTFVLEPASGTTLTFSGDIGGTGRVALGNGECCGHSQGRIVFHGNNSYTGETTFSDWSRVTFEVNGRQPQSVITYGFDIKGILGGIGTVGLVRAGGGQGNQISPGAVPGPGILHTGSVDFQAVKQFVVELNGDNPGNTIDNYDQLQVQ